MTCESPRDRLRRMTRAAPSVGSLRAARPGVDVRSRVGACGRFRSRVPARCQPPERSTGTSSCEDLPVGFGGGSESGGGFEDAAPCRSSRRRSSPRRAPRSRRRRAARRAPLVAAPLLPAARRRAARRSRSAARRAMCRAGRATPVDAPMSMPTSSTVVSCLDAPSPESRGGGAVTRNCHLPVAPSKQKLDSTQRAKRTTRGDDDARRGTPRGPPRRRQRRRGRLLRRDGRVGLKPERSDIALHLSHQRVHLRRREPRFARRRRVRRVVATATSSRSSRLRGRAWRRRSSSSSSWLVRRSARRVVAKAAGEHGRTSAPAAAAGPGSEFPPRPTFHEPTASAWAAVRRPALPPPP